MDVAPSSAVRAALASLNKRPVSPVDVAASARQKADDERRTEVGASASAERARSRDDGARAGDARIDLRVELGTTPPPRIDGRPVRPGSIVDVLV
jgi:hypothetical protein